MIELDWTRDEFLTIAAARTLTNGTSCFVGIGIPSTAAILAQRTHAPNLTLIYESGTFGTNPSQLPLSIGDGDLAHTSLTVVSLPEIFNYWLQPGRIDVGFLGAAQVDRFGNINSTIIGSDYEHPKVRLPGAGGAPEIAAACREVTIIVRQSPRTLLESVDFITSIGHGPTGKERTQLGLRGHGPTRVITDLGILEPDTDTKELMLTTLHPGVTVDDVVAATGWALRVAPNLTTSAEPSSVELEALRALTSHSMSVSLT